MRDFARTVSAALFVLSGVGAARCEAPKCSNEEATRAIGAEATSVFLLFARYTGPTKGRDVQPSEITTKVADIYETDHGEFTRNCHGHLAISFEGATPEAEINYQVIQTEDGKILTKWDHGPDFGQGLIMQFTWQRAVAEQQAKEPNASPEQVMRDLLTPKPVMPPHSSQ